jgi:WD40 repeat protein
VVATLAAARLIVLDRDQLTLAHEALLHAWPRLSEWIAEERADLLALQELRGATERWATSGRSDTDLYRGPRLDAALALAEHERLNTDESAFVEAGRKLRQREQEDARRRTRRLRGLAAVTSIAAVIALIGGGIAVVQRNNAQHSQDAANEAARSAGIEAIIGRASSLRSSQRDAAALLAVEAFRLDDTARSRSALLATFTGSEGFLDAHRIHAVQFGDAIFLPGSDAAYVTTEDGRLRSYDLDTGELGEEFPALGRPGYVGGVAASPDGELLAQARSVEGRLTPTRVGVFEVANRSLRFPPVIVDGSVFGVAFVRSGSALALAVGAEGRVVVLDAASGNELATVPGVAASKGRSGGSTVAAVDGLLVVGSADGSLRILDGDTFELQRTISLRPDTVSTLRAVGDGTMVTTGRAGLARVHLADGTVDWQLAEVDTCQHLAVVADRGTFYCGDGFGGLVERDLETGFAVRGLDAQNGNTGELWPIRGGTELVSFGWNEPVVSRWRLDGSGPITHLVAPGYRPVDFDPTGARLLVEQGTRPEDHTSRVVDAGTGELVLDLGGLVAPTWFDDNTIMGVVAEGEKLRAVHVQLDHGDVVPDELVPNRVPAGAEHDTGKQRALLFYDDNAGTAVSSIDLATKELGPTIPVDTFVSMAISRSGHRIAVGTSGGGFVYDGTTGERLGTIPGSAPSVFITVADQLFTASLGGELTQYDLGTLKPIRTFAGSRGFIQRALGTADGTIVATDSGDRSVRLYDVATGVSLGTPITLENEEEKEMALSLDGTRLAIGGPRGVGPDAVQIWDLDPRDWVEAACRLAGRNLTRDEWASNIGDLAPYRATCPAFPADG